MSGKLKSHPYADLFPMMTATELEALAADIAENGQRQAIVLYQGKVLDGRNRLLACEKVGIEPKVEEFDGDDAGALALVISLNVQRRDLTAAQRAIVAARTLEVVADTHGGDRKSSARSVHLKRDDVAKTFKVGVNAVQQAKAILAEAPDLAAQVESCALSLAGAYDQAQERKRLAVQRAKDLERVADLKDAISSGELKVDEALQLAITRAREEREKAEHDASARKLWWDGLRQLLQWVEQYVGTREDGHLSWYSEDGAPGAVHAVAAEQVAAAIGHLGRVYTITCGGKKNVKG
jgi:hypothetical protein